MPRSSTRTARSATGLALSCSAASSVRRSIGEGSDGSLELITGLTPGVIARIINKAFGDSDEITKAITTAPLWPGDDCESLPPRKPR
jgi:hypothetical protein